MTQKDAKVNGPNKLVRIARWLLLPYFVGVAFWAFGTFLMAGYGLAHASEGAIGTFMLTLALIAAAAIGLPLALLTNSPHPLWAALRGLGLVVMGYASYHIAQMAWQMEIEPRMMTAKFRSVMARLQPGAVREEALLIGGQIAGVRVSAEFQVAEPTAMDQYGSLLLEAMRSMHLTPTAPSGGAVPFTKIPWNAILSFQGKPLEALPGFARPANPGVIWPSPSAVLPAGTYRAESQFWFTGIASLPGDEQVCREDSLDKDQWHTAGLKQLHQPMRPVIATRLSLKYRLGYPGYRHEWAPLQFRADEAAWRAAFSTLPLQPCATRKQALESEAKAREKSQAEERFAAGDKSLPDRLNPLYLAMCAGDMPEAQRLLAEPVAARFRLEPMVIDCAVKRADPAMLALALPKLFEQTRLKEDYCSVLRSIYAARSTALLQQISTLKLPLKCEGMDTNLWSLSFEGRDESGNPKKIEWNDDTHRWLEFVSRQGTTICTRPNDGSLLAEAILEAAPKTIELLLNAGCDPRTFGRSAKAAELTAGEQWLGSATSLWPIRRYLRGRSGIGVLTSEEIDKINSRMGTVTDEYIGINQDGATFQYRFRRQLLAEPALLRYVLQHGGQVDFAGGKQCESWYTPGYRPSDPSAAQLPEKALLDSLSDQELAALTKPIAVSCSPRPMTETANFAPNGLGTYLCRRGVIACPERK